MDKRACNSVVLELIGIALMTGVVTALFGYFNFGGNMSFGDLFGAMMLVSYGGLKYRTLKNGWVENKQLPFGLDRITPMQLIAHLIIIAIAIVALDFAIYASSWGYRYQSNTQIFFRALGDNASMFVVLVLLPLATIAACYAGWFAMRRQK